jgi:hypothetical protein
MTDRHDKASAGGSALAGSAKLVAAIAILLLAAMAILVVLDAISLAMFGAFTKKILLTACIVLLASIAIGLLSRIGRP